MSQARNQEYVRVKLQSLLNDFASAVLSSYPSNISEFALHWLEQKRDSSLSIPEQQELKHLKQELVKLRNGQEVFDETDESSEDSDDTIEDHHLRKASLKMRSSVSAEAYGSWNKKTDFSPRKIPKTNDQLRRIIQVINKCFMFSSLDKSEKEVLAMAFEERRFCNDESVIAQGEDGSELFVVDSGEFACFRQFTKEDSPKFLKDYCCGEAFGELALLYNVPRAATIKARGEGVCWVLDRDCFNHIVKEASQKKRERYEQFLAGVDLLSEIDSYERSQIADALQSVNYVAGEYIIREGEIGDVFYFIEEGEAVATKALNPGLPPVEVLQYTAGNYFGELALLKSAPRAANVLAKTNMKCAIMDRRAFKRILGPLEAILQRNAGAYEAYKF